MQILELFKVLVDLGPCKLNDQGVAGIKVYLETVGCWIAFPKSPAHSNLVALSGLRKAGFSSDSVASWNLIKKGLLRLLCKSTFLPVG